jgi:glycosyltransferase involved in cell wall biosynthesis
MKIAFLWCGSVTAGWSIGDGLANAFSKAGHQVLRIPRGRQECPLVTVQALNVADAIVVSGPEHIFRSQVKGDGANAYTFTSEELTVYEWLHEVKPPKIFLYHESNRREDQTFGFEDFLTYGDYHFFPAVQDAETYDQEHFAKGRSFWLPFGVDTDVFKPLTCSRCTIKGLGGGYRPGKVSPVTGLEGFSARELLDGKECPQCLGTGFAKSPKDIDVGFVGLMYPKRNQFISHLSQHMKQGRDPWVVIGNVQVLDMDGPAWTDQVLRLAQNYRRCKSFFNLPAYSELVVSKVVEVMACGTFILTPMLEGAAERNCAFQHGKELVYYHPTNLPFLVQTLREFVERDQLREQIALAGMAKVHETLSLKVQVPEILSKCGIEKKKEVLQ